MAFSSSWFRNGDKQVLVGTSEQFSASKSTLPSLRGDLARSRIVDYALAISPKQRTRCSHGGEAPPLEERSGIHL